MRSVRRPVALGTAAVLVLGALSAALGGGTPPAASDLGGPVVLDARTSPARLGAPDDRAPVGAAVIAETPVPAAVPIAVAADAVADAVAPAPETGAAPDVAEVAPPTTTRATTRDGIDRDGWDGDGARDGWDGDGDPDRRWGDGDGDGTRTRDAGSRTRRDR